LPIARLPAPKRRLMLPLSPTLMRRMRPVLPRRWRVPLAFAPRAYLAAHPDVTAAPLWHFLRHGRAEGRIPCALRATGLEAALWAGDTAAEAGLQALAGDTDLPEALWARIALARVAAMAGRFGAADRLLGDAGRLEHVFGLAGPVLLSAEMALRLCDRPRAAATLRRAMALPGGRVGGLLLQAALALQTSGRDAWARNLAPLYAAQGLVGPELAGSGLAGPGLAAGDGPAFDRLCAKAGAWHEDGPLVSIIMPARNAALTIDTALAGLAAQSWRRLEIVVVENGSTDETPARLAAWAARDPRIVAVTGNARGGAYGARNLGAGLARGEVIGIHDADDWSHTDRIAQQMQALTAAPDSPACLSHWVRMTPDLCPALWRPDLAPVHANLSSLMIRRAVIDRLGLWDRVRAGADTEYVARLRHVFGPRAVTVACPGLPLAFGRVTAGALTRGDTGLLGPGAAARSAYLAAARDWHARSEYPRLPADPHPFAVPEALRIDPEGGA